MTRAWVAIVIAIATAGTAFGDPEADAERAFRDAKLSALAGERARGWSGGEQHAALDAFEALGAARPITRWTDDAWAEAALLAERAGDFARARRDLEQVIAIGTDDGLVRRARATLDRLAAITGGGRWDAIATEHERLVGAIQGGGDPRVALEALEALAASQPQYPRATAARLAVAHGWEREGQPERALGQLRTALSGAPPAERQRVGLALARALIRRGALDEAAGQLDALAAMPGTDRAAIADLRDRLATAAYRASVRWVLSSVLAALALAAVVALRRDAGSWRHAGRHLIRPPLEVAFLAPIAAVLAVVAQTGNPLVARAVTAIAVIAVVVSWVSGSLLEAARRRHGRVGVARAIAQASIALAAVGCATYLVVDRDRLLDLIAETWEHGPAAR